MKQAVTAILLAATCLAVNAEEGLAEANDRYEAMTRSMQRAADAFTAQGERLDREAKEPHWVCWLTVLPQTARAREDGCTLVSNLEEARETVILRERLIATSASVAAVLAFLGLGIYLFKTLARRTMKAAGSIVESAAHTAGKVSMVVEERTSGLAAAFRAGREERKRGR